MEKTRKTGPPPIAPLSVLNPFLVELQERNCNARQLLGDMSLPTDIPTSGEIFVPLQVVYELVEASAALAEDRFFGFEVGRSVNVRTWDAIAKSAELSTTAVELLLRFVHLSSEHATSRFRFRTGPRRSTIEFEPPIEDSVTPSQYDAFSAIWQARPGVSGSDLLPRDRRRDSPR